MVGCEIFRASVAHIFGFALNHMCAFFTRVLIVACAKKVDEANECIAMDGALTVYTDDGTPSTGEDEIRSALRKGMEDGDFAESPIVRVSYVDLDTYPDPNKNDGGNQVSSQGGGRNRGMVYGVVAGIVTLLLLALAVLWRRKKKHDDETSTLENETLEANETTVDSAGV